MKPRAIPTTALINKILVVESKFFFSVVTVLLIMFNLIIINFIIMASLI